MLTGKEPGIENDMTFDTPVQVVRVRVQKSVLCRGSCVIHGIFINNLLNYLILYYTVRVVYYGICTVTFSI